MSDSASSRAPGRDRRRSDRVPFGLRVRVNVRSQGILIDLSEGGALLRMASPLEPPRQVTIAIEGYGDTIHLPARVIRSSPLPPDDASHSGGNQYDVAVEFLNVEGESLAAIRGMLGQRL